MVSREPVAHQLICAHKETGGNAIAIREVPPQDVGRFGIVRVRQTVTTHLERLIRLSGLVGKPSAVSAPSRLGIFGRYVLHASILNAIGKTRPDPNGEIQLTNALNLLSQDEPLFGVCFEGQHYDAGDPLGYLMANLEIALQHPRLREPLQDHISDLHVNSEH